MKTKKNSRALWQGINEIIYSKKAHKTNSPSFISRPNIPQMAEHFNQYFTSIGKNLQKRIPPTKRQFSDYLKDSNQNSFFIQPTTVEEVKDIIMTLMSSKSMGPNIIPAFLLKQTRNTVSLPPAKLIKKSFETGIFPEICKAAKDSNQNSFFIQPTTAEEVKDIIMTLMSSKSMGPNGIPAFLLKQTRNTVSLPPAKLIKKSFETGIFPDICKVAKVVLIFKSETMLLCNNYRPVSLLSNIGKIIEKLMHQRPNFFLEQYNCYYPFQFGFRLNYSTDSVRMSISENIQTLLDNGEFAAGVFVDLRKAFDTVDHRILIRKPEHYGVRGI